MGLGLGSGSGLRLGLGLGLGVALEAHLLRLDELWGGGGGALARGGEGRLAVELDRGRDGDARGDRMLEVDDHVPG